MLVDRMNRAPSPAIIHVRLRCWVAWMAAGNFRGGSSTWAVSVHPALVVQGGQAQPVLHSVRGSLRSLACGCFAYNIYLGVTFCAAMFVIRACFYGSVFCGDVVSSGTAPSQSSSGWVASRNFLFVRCPSQSLLCDKGFSCSCYFCFCVDCAACETAGFLRL